MLRGDAKIDRPTSRFGPIEVLIGEGNNLNLATTMRFKLFTFHSHIVIYQFRLIRMKLGSLMNKSQGYLKRQKSLLLLAFQACDVTSTMIIRQSSICGMPEAPSGDVFGTALPSTLRSWYGKIHNACLSWIDDCAERVIRGV